MEGNHIRSEALLKISLGVTLGGESYWVRCIIEDIFGSHRGRGSYWVYALLKTSLGVTLGRESYWVRCIIEDIFGSHRGKELFWVRSIIEDIFGDNPGRGVIIIGSDALLKTSLGVTVRGNHIGSMRY